MIPTPVRAALLAIFLVAIGFVVGFGYHAARSAPPVGPPVAPIAKGLTLSPDDHLLAFAGVYEGSTQASRFVLDIDTLHYVAQTCPRGWQDYPTQWSADGKEILLAREKIPRPVEDATGGIYQQKIASPDSNAANGAAPGSEPELLSDGVTPAQEKSIAGFWAPSGQLILKTQSAPKALWGVDNGQGRLLDRADVTYYQNRAVQENGGTALYVVRDLPAQPQSVALLRLAGGTAKQLSVPLHDVIWAYVAENARWMMVCRQGEAANSWAWDLYSVTPQAARLAKTGAVPDDVIAVYWSPDFKHILGASGKSLWLIDIPTLAVHRLGTRTDWNADDAAWLHREQAVLVASNGHLWRVAIPGGDATDIWTLPNQYWH